MTMPSPITLEQPDTGFSRRSALKLLSAQIALAVAGCGKPPDEIVPYVRMPERLVPGVPLEFASSLPLGGYGRGVICSSLEGRPIKVSGNPRHPASLGSTDVFAEAAVFSLYDPDRSQAVRSGGEISSWQALQTALVARFASWASSEGDGLRLLTGPLTSPTALLQIDALKQRYPKLQWHMHDPLRDVSAERGAEMAFGKTVRLLPRWAELDVLLTLDADPLGPGPAQIRNGRGFSDRRRVRHDAPTMLRHYAIEAAPTLSGSNADHKMVLPVEAIGSVAVSLARGLGADLPDPGLPTDLAHRIASIVEDLRDRHGRALVLAGASLRPDIHALVHWINAKLGAPLAASDPLIPPGLAGLEELARDLEAGSVDTLLIAGCNPAYDAPPSMRLEQLIPKAALSVHLGMHFDETAAVTTWHVPESHPLESWSDLRSIEGSSSVVQPLIRPLYSSHTIHGLLASLLGTFDASDYEIVRSTWRSRSPNPDFESGWRRILQDGVVEGSAQATEELRAPALPTLLQAEAKPGFTLVLRPDPCLWDGSHANNAWLQECPKPLTKEVWGNALGIGAEDAGILEVSDGDLLRIATETASIIVPVRVQAGHAPGTLSLSLGYGRVRGGTLGSGIGANGFTLIAHVGQRVLTVAAVKTGQRRPITSTQEQFQLDGDAADLFPRLDLDRFPEAKPPAPNEPVPTLLPVHHYQAAAARWAMVIDAGACIGCNACVVACQVENNVPVIGPEEIARHRDMHWLRIDRYELGEGDEAASGFQPVPCMHCETAPCEPVCPVGASVHDSEGLNVQVYNRCIGTRFCEANCPYKVRRFNFFGYADDQPYGDLGKDVVRAHYNPNVTVRARGVMEKCTYCVQRISGARRAAEKENRPLGDGDVVTACQSACPTRAISFGNLNEEKSTVGELRREPHHYALLGHLDTKPRTTYLAKIRNKNPELDKEPG